MEFLSLKKTLQLNSAFSLLCALALFIFSAPLAQIIGAVEPWMLHIVGAALVIWALDLLWVASKPLINQGLVKVIVVADVGWVLGTVVLLVGFEAMFTTEGVALLTAVALAVLAIALLQLRALLAGRENVTTQKIA